MAMQYGVNVAKYAIQGRVSVLNSGWTALQVGSTPHSGRFSVRIFVKGNPGQALALTYVNIGLDGTFTDPGGRTWIEPLSDRVTLYGRLVDKAAETRGSVVVIVTEYS